MAYGQENYTQELGSGPYTIAEAGCFLVADCNLLERFGVEVDPVTLNNFFKQHKDYIAGDELAFTTVTAYDSHVVETGSNTSGWPQSNNAIVKFIYKLNGVETTHFCLVADYTTHSIIDSFDGKTKTPAQYQGVYGQPVAWATYGGPVSHPVTPVATNPVPVKAYSVAAIAPVTMQAKTNPTHEWGLNATTWPAFQAVKTINPGDQVTVSAIATHELGSRYYMPDPNQPYGYNIVDLENVPAAAPAAPPAAAGMVNITVEKGWGLERVAAAAGRSDAAHPSTWQAIAQANGSGDWQTFNAHLQPGQVVKVPTGGLGEGEDTPGITVDPINPTQYMTNKQPTDKWDFTATPAKVVSQLNADTPYIAVAKATLPDGSIYLLTNAQDTTGVNANDLSAPTPSVNEALEPGTTVSPTAGSLANAKLSTEEQLAYKTTTGVYKIIGDALNAERVTVHDVTGELPDIQIAVGRTLKVAGSLWVNGTRYFRTLTSAEKNNWYAIDAKLVAYLGPLHKALKTVEEKWDDALDELAHDGMEFEEDIEKKEPEIRDHVVEDLGKARSGVGRLFHRTPKPQGA